MARMIASRSLRAASGNGAPKTGFIAETGTEVEVLEEADIWSRIRLPETDGAPEGWVPSAAIGADSDVSAALDEIEVADYCVRRGYGFGCSPYYLMALAELRSDLMNLPGDGPGGLRGIFAMTEPEWEAMRDNPAYLVSFQPGSILVWRAQVLAFAAATAAMQRRVAEVIDRQPSMAELAFAQVFGSAALKTALDAPQTPVETVIAGLDADALIAEDVDAGAIAQRGLPLADGTPIEDVMTALKDGLQTAFDGTADSVQSKAEAYLQELAAAGAGTPQPVAEIDWTSPHLQGLSEERLGNARLILEMFAKAGYGAVAQVAALANGIAESGLDQTAANLSGESSIGIFQLNQQGGLGQGYDAAYLKVARNNIAIMLNEILKPYQKAAREIFMTTDDLREAVRVFVYEFERPADKPGQAAKRFEIAQTLVA
jgi:hypothetical protein